MENSEKENIVQPVNLGHVNIYLISTEKGYILVDTGMPDKQKEFEKLFQKLGIDLKNIQLIILTHGHLDHVGSTAFVKRITGAKVLCHRSYSMNLAKGKIEPAVPQNILGKILNFMTGLSGSKIEAIAPDFEVDDEFNLSEFGVSGKVIHTPGHSKSSISIALDSGEILVGDLIREEKPGVLGYGMFFEDKDTVLESLKNLAAFDPRVIYLSHSTTIDRQALNDFIEVQ